MYNYQNSFRAQNVYEYQITGDVLIYFKIPCKLSNVNKISTILQRQNISIIFTFSPLETAIREYSLAPTNTTQSLNMCGSNSKPSPPFPFISHTLTSNRGFVKLTWLSLEPKEMPPLLPSAFCGTCRSNCRGFMHCKSGLHTSIAIFAINLLEARQLVPNSLRFTGTCFSHGRGIKYVFFQLAHNEWVQNYIFYNSKYH